MNGTIRINLAPVVGQDGEWGGVWFAANPEDAHILGNFTDLLSTETGGLRIFIDGCSNVPIELFDSLPPQRTFIVDHGNTPPGLEQLKAKGFDFVGFGHEFAAGISSQAQLDSAKANGAQWFSGEFISHPPVVEGKKDSGRTTLLKLLTLIAEDADSAEIEQVFKREPELSFNLFRLVNSVSLGLNTKISTFNQAIMVLGRRQMQRWIQLMLYTRNQNADAANPLLQLAALRARLMERLAVANGWDAAKQEQAFMAGIFSLLDTLLGMKMTEILSIISLPDEVQSALLGQGGELSEMLAFVNYLQAGNTNAQLPAFMAIGSASLAECQFDALKWAAGMSQEMG